MKDVVLGRKTMDGKSLAEETSGRRGSALRLQADLVIDGSPEPLLAAHVPLRRLHRNVPEKELDLLKFSARRMA